MAQVGTPAAVLSVAIGSVCVQVTAQLSGTGLGLLLHRRLVAFIGTIILPLGVWLLLGAIGPIAFCGSGDTVRRGVSDADWYRQCHRFLGVGCSSSFCGASC